MTTSAPIDHNMTTSAPTDHNMTTSAPIDHNMTTSAPIDPNMTTSAPTDHNMTTSAPIDHTMTTSAPIDNNMTTSAPTDHMTTINSTTDTTTVMPSTSNNTSPSPVPPTEHTTPVLSSTVTTNTSGLPPTTSPSNSTSSSVPSSSSPGNTTTPSPSATTQGATDGTTDQNTNITSTAHVTATTMNPPSSPSQSASTTAPVTTQGPLIACPSSPCPAQSICLDGACQCLTGDYLENGQCQSARVFTGQLHLVSLTFEEDMRNRSSSIFQKTSADISAELNNILKNQSGYIRSDVVQLTPGSVQATVNNIFRTTAAVTQDSVNQAIIDNINGSHGLLANASYTDTDPCGQIPFHCDVSTTTCISRDGLAFCSCMEGYTSIVYSNTSCKACPSGQKADGDQCQPCPFGYAGFNCSDSALLAVVIVSCVLGGILLILVLGLLIYCCWRTSSNSKADHTTSPYAGDLNQSWPSGVTPIPRANSNWSYTPSMEMTEGGSTNTLVEKKQYSNGSSGSYDLNPEKMKTFKGKNPSRYSYLVQGHENPYFLPGDEKRD
ncbi:protein HEG isoform X2 [Gouania willdenowi]|uniref:protein HEG isoform X2 n=1 Tax=Gouania willdenowi TaxID=441366 RepID=UPI001054C163|nr:protein HEG-like isoform X2 [Gouania willdenowi]